MEKKFLSYLPARLVKGHRWYIIFYQVDPATGLKEKFRRTYGLNRIPKLAERKRKAASVVKELNEIIPLGYPFTYSSKAPYTPVLDALQLICGDQYEKHLVWQFFREFCKKEKLNKLRIGKLTKRHAKGFLNYCYSKEISVEVYNSFLDQARQVFDKLVDQEYLKKNYFKKINYKDEAEELRKTNILEALALAQKIKVQSTDRERTVGMVDSMCKIFTAFIEKKKWEKREVGKFGKKEAMAFLDYAVLDRGVGARTHNNYIERMRSMFTELVKREYLKENPFSRMGKKKEAAKIRRALNDHEKKLMASEISRSGKKWLMLGVVLQYHCFIRPVELRRLRFHFFNLKEGTIRLPGAVTKNAENSILTIPDSILPFLRSYNFDSYNQGWLIFGKGVEPHPSKSCGHNTLNTQQHQILKKLIKKKLIGNTQGITFYSWKDTGALALFKNKVNILEIMRQMRHKDLSTTQKYCESLYVINEEIKALKNDLIYSSGALLVA